MNISEETLAMLKGSLRKDNQTAGIATATGLNFFYLEPQAKNIYPVFYPVLASTPRVNPMFNGQRVGGTAVNWKAIVAIDAGGDPSISEGNRNEFMNLTERDYNSTFKFLGKDTEVSFQAQQSGLGLDDNIALAQLAMLNALLNDEERMLLYGNSGPSGSGGNNGYALGTTPTPGTPTTATSGGSIPASSTNAVFCVALTAWGTQKATSTGVALPRLRTNSDGSSDIINGGTAVISAVSANVATTGSTSVLNVSVTPVQGAFGYAWYISQNASPTTANAFFSAVTSTATAVLTTYNASNQAGNAQSSTITGAPGNLTADHSYNNLNFDGLTTWTINTASASQPSYYKDLNGAGFTSNGDGSIAEFEAVADFLWTNYKASVDKIYAGGNLIQSISKAILTANAGPGAQRIMFQSDEAGRLVGGTKIAQYRWKYSNTAAPKVIDVMAHPWLPQGAVYFDITTNPYPAAGNTIPAVRRIVSLEDHFSIKWPYRKLEHELGVYCFETLEHYIPFASGLIVGAANKVN